MIRTGFLPLMACCSVIAACDGGSNSASPTIIEQSASTDPATSINPVRTDTLVLYDSGTVRAIGKVKVCLDADLQLHPCASTIAVVVVRAIPDEHSGRADELNIDAGNAYLVQRWSVLYLDQDPLANAEISFEHLRTVDLSQSDMSIADSFGMKIDSSRPVLTGSFQPKKGTFHRQTDLERILVLENANNEALSLGAYNEEIELDYFLGFR